MKETGIVRVEEMSEVKIILPAYIRSGVCGDCGAVIYSPQGSAVSGNLPSMSACVCDEGPKVVSLLDARTARRTNRLIGETKAKAA